MLTLESLKAEVDGLRFLVHMADSDSVQTRQLFKAQTQMMIALRADQQGIAAKLHAQAETLAHQAAAIGDLVVSMNETQEVMRGLQIDAYDLKADVKTIKSDLGGMVLRQDRMDQRMGNMEQRMERMEHRQDRMGQNIDAIMRHLGVEPGA